MEKLWSIFSTYNINFDPFYAAYNILTKKVLREKETTRFLQVETIGQERYTSFVKEKLEGIELIWDTLKKEKLLTFINNNKTVLVRIDTKDVQVRINFISDLFLQKSFLDVSTLDITFSADVNFVTQCFSQTMFSLDSLKF